MTVRIRLMAAMGGMAGPLAMYLAFNGGGCRARGWRAAMSTGTAFLLGLFSLLAPGRTRLRVRRLALAPCDDLVAVIVIATAYSSRVSPLGTLQRAPNRAGKICRCSR
ncbi:MAG: Na+/H+ antiporter NhaA [Solirubrobacteraceae bacterium]